MNKIFYLLITGPESIVPEGFKVEKLVITPEDIEEAREDNETDSEVIDYIIDDEAGGWEQHFCKVQVLSEEKYQKFLEKNSL
jgi:hypothetical protein